MSDSGTPPQNPYGQDPYGQSEPTSPYGQSEPTSPYAQQPGAQPYGSPTGANPTYGDAGGQPDYYGNTGAAKPGFIGALFDLSFSTFITPMVVKVVYVLGMIAIGILTLFLIGAGVVAMGQGSAGSGILMIILAPVVALLYLAFFRMTLEFYVAITRMSEDIHNRLPSR